MRVVQVTHMYPKLPGDRYGITMQDQIRALAESCGVESSVIAPTPWVPHILHSVPRWKGIAHCPSHATLRGIEVSYPKYLTAPRGFLRQMGRRAFCTAAASAFRQTSSRKKVDLVHAHMAIPDGLAAFKISRLYSCPFVVTIQATDLDLTAQAGGAHAIQLAQIFAAAAAVMSPSPRLTRAFAAQFGYPIVTVPYGIHLDDPHGDAGDTRAELPPGKILLTVARLLRSKGIDDLIRACSRLVNNRLEFHLVIVGDGPDRGRLETIVRSTGLTEHVSFLGALPHREVLRYMAACDVFVLPSWRETFGLVYLEAMAAGKPVIGVREQGIDGIIEEGKTGFLVAPRSIHELAGALWQLLSDSDLAHTTGANARSLVLDTLTWQRTAERTMEIYEQAIP